MSDKGLFGGHRLTDDSVPAGKLTAAAKDEVLARRIFIRPLYVKAATAPANGTSTFTVSSATAPSTGGNVNGIVVGPNETSPYKANVGLLTADGTPIIGPNARPVFGRITAVSGAGPYTYTVTICDAADQTLASPAAVVWSTGTMGATVGLVELPIRRDLQSMDELELKDRFVGLAVNERDQETLDDLSEIYSKTGIVEGAANTFSTTNYVANSDSLKAAIGKLDNSLKTVSNTVAGMGGVTQTEVDAIEAGAGLNANGTFTAPTGTNYLGAATNLKNADTLLDSAIKAVANEVDAIEAGAGLNSTGSYTAPTGTSYLGAATSLKDADVKNDAATKAVSDRVTTVENWKTAEGVTVDNETPVGTIDGTNVAFTLANAPKAGTLHLMLCGVELLEGTHFTVSGAPAKNITYTAGIQPQTGEWHRATYRY